jgi:hypothetical protein
MARRRSRTPESRQHAGLRDGAALPQSAESAQERWLPAIEYSAKASSEPQNAAAAARRESEWLETRLNDQFVTRLR